MSLRTAPDSFNTFGLQGVGALSRAHLHAESSAPDRPSARVEKDEVPPYDSAEYSSLSVFPVLSTQNDARKSIPSHLILGPSLQSSANFFRCFSLVALFYHSLMRRVEHRPRSVAAKLH